MKLILKKPDTLGAIASSLCVIHCLATPFLFIAQSCSTVCCDAAPTWWKSMDYIFLIISFFAVYQTTQTTTKSYMKPILWTCWMILFSIIVNQSISWIAMSDNPKYVAAFLLASFHIYNLKYCQCKNDKCCANGG